MNKRFIISGMNRLSGNYLVQGNKNAALPLIAASLLARNSVRFSRVPRILDVENMLHIIESLNCKTTWDASGLSIDTSKFEPAEPSADLIEKLRGSILLLGAMAPRAEKITCALPGGCPIGRRSFDAHWKIFRNAGFSVSQERGKVEISRKEKIAIPRTYLDECSVTATENALILFANLGSGIIENPAREPHVLSLVNFLRKLGCEIELHPLYFRVHQGVNPDVEPIEFTIPADYIDAGTIMIATAVTRGKVLLEGVEDWDLQGFHSILNSFGIKTEKKPDQGLLIDGTSSLTSPDRIVAGLWPSFPTDLVSLVIVLVTQSRGICLVHDWMYESRMFFVDKLVRMGARITMCDPHRVMVEGPTSLRGTRLESPDIRAGMALMVAGLCARGTTTIEHAEVIERGYECSVERLSQLGAEIIEEQDTGISI